MEKTIQQVCSIDPTFYVKGRLETYVDWPFSPKDKCNANKMALAGFVKIGDAAEPDLVQCFICLKQLDGWDPKDNPWDEHKKHDSNCLFVKINKQDEKKLTIAELLQLIKVFKVNHSKKTLQSHLEKVLGRKENCAKKIPGLM